MSTATDERVDFDIDLDATATCVLCDTEAAWHARTLPCGHGVALFCEPHRVLMEIHFASLDPACTVCGQDVTRIQWRPL